jgi:5-deoxy-5-amino-3-dehydroquinate synthase
VIRVTVPLSARPYDVVVGDGARRCLADEIARVAPEARSATIVTQAPLLEAGWLEGLSTGLEARVVRIPEGEDHKSLGTIETLLRAFVEHDLSRHDLVVAFGGGLVSDVAGFAAATYHRGIGYVTVATSLLAQVDAAIGGKTGVNLPEGKNLAGAFWQPLVVLADTELLATLPPVELACGRGEMAKYAFLDGIAPSSEILSLPVDEQVARCARIKAAVVAEDEREGGRRMILNYGHTLGHALEALGLEERAAAGPGRVGQLRHGQAVAIGLIFAAMLAERLGRIDPARVALHREVVAGFGLDGSLPEGLAADRLVAAMARDKKAHHDLTFVLDGPRGVEAVRSVPVEAVLATLAEMGATR